MDIRKSMHIKISLSELLKKFYPDLLAIAGFLLLSFLYFQEPLTGGLALMGHDNDASLGLAQDKVNFEQETGETTRWTNSTFSGMPTYQISPSYESSDVLQMLSKAYSLGTTGVLAYVFLYMLGFYLLLRAFNFRVWLASLGAVVWAFSSYFFIIIAAGHIWKVMTLGLIPPTIAGVVLCYRGRLLLGGAVTALFTALQIQANHIQMSYYFFFVMLFIALAYAGGALLKKTDDYAGELSIKKWLKSTAVIIVAGLLGVAANLSNLYHTQQYSKESMRGKAELTPLASAGGEKKNVPTDGLDFDYITGWSYGVDETLTLMIPDFKGGGSGESIFETKAAEKHDAFLPMVQRLYSEIGIQPPGISAYWGEQPGTVGPVYVGAIVCFLFVLGIFVVRGPIKWALLAATLLSFIFAWGRNIPEVTHFLIDHLPLYNKFRTVSSALVIAEFTMPLLAMLALAEVLRRRDWLNEMQGKIQLALAFLLTGGICALFWLAPETAGDCITTTEADFFEQLRPYQAQLSVNLEEYRQELSALRHDVLADSAKSSFLLILAGIVVLFCYARFRSIRHSWIVCAVLLAICATDMWKENKRYLNDDCFDVPNYREQLATMTTADNYILADQDPHFRVYDVNGFSGNRTGYYHKSVGGYHAAKLRRYQDLIERHISTEARTFVSATFAHQKTVLADTLRLIDANVKNEQDIYEVIAEDMALDSTIATPVLNMLNTKYFIFDSGSIAARNPHANGNAWYVTSLKFVDGADAEIGALKGIDSKNAAVADASFREQLDGTSLSKGNVVLTSYAPNEMHYETDNANDGVVVFSEIYYPGWTATIDGQPAELGRANYVLRALKVPAGKHEIVLEFRPQSITATEAVAYIAILLIVAAFIAALLKGCIVQKSETNE